MELSVPASPPSGVAVVMRGAVKYWGHLPVFGGADRCVKEEASARVSLCVRWGGVRTLGLSLL